MVRSDVYSFIFICILRNTEFFASIAGSQKTSITTSITWRNQQTQATKSTDYLHSTLIRSSEHRDDVWGKTRQPANTTSSPRWRATRPLETIQKANVTSSPLHYYPRAIACLLSLLCFRLCSGLFSMFLHRPRPSASGHGRICSAGARVQSCVNIIAECLPNVRSNEFASNAIECVRVGSKR